MKYLLILLLTFSLSGCSYTQSALGYSKEGTKRADAGHKANKGYDTNMRVKTSTTTNNYATL